jgi:hypothetical protein
MYFAPVFKPSKKLISGVILMLLSMLLVAYAPMASISMAESAADTAKLQALKQKALDELNRRITSYEKTMKSLNVDVDIKNDTSTDTNGLNTIVKLPAKAQDQSKQFMQTILDELKQLKEKVTGSTSLTEMQGLGNNIDSQFGLDQLTQVQAMATQAIESMTGVFDNLKSAFNGVQSQVTQIKQCASTTTSASTDECNGVDVAVAADTSAQAQSQLDSLSSIMSTISSVLTSAIALLMTLLTSFTSMSGGLGSLSSLGNLSSLSSLTGLLGGAGGLGDLSSLTGSLGSITGMLGSFSAISSQLDITQLMSGSSLGSLSSLTSLIGPLTSIMGSFS